MVEQVEMVEQIALPASTRASATGSRGRLFTLLADRRFE